jgi:Fe-S-cluster containining protein
MRRVVGRVVDDVTPNLPGCGQGTASDLDALYAELPRIDCVGLCRDTCGPIDMSRAERQRIARAGVDIPAGSLITYDCPALTMLGQCSVYKIRPLICRIWGLTKRLHCNYGCRPSRWLTEPEAYTLIARAYDISGQRDKARQARLAAAPEHQAMMTTIRDVLSVMRAEEDRGAGFVTGDGPGSLITLWTR